MSASIPDEIAAEAKRVYFQRCDEVDRLAQDLEEGEVLDLIARAIMDERERCARIAMTFSAMRVTECDHPRVEKTAFACFDEVASQRADMIAAAIRNGG